MDPARLATELTHARFGSTQFRQGYAMAEVDRFIDEVVAALQSGAPAEQLAARLRDVQFTTTSLQRGYDMADVDAALESVMTSVRDGSSRPAPPARATPSTPSSAGPASSPRRGTGAPRQGVLGRLLAAVRGDQPLR